MPDGMMLPAYADDLQATLAEAWRLLGRGTADRRSPFHHPVIGTIGADGTPRTRTVILRGCDSARRALRFHTDRRADKVAELTASPLVSVHGYDPGAKIQIRLEGQAAIHHDDTVADQAWTQSQRMSRACYGTVPAPGSALDEVGAFSLPQTDDEIAAGRANFCAVIITARRLEWLFLAHGGHRRALFSWEASGAGQSTWLVP